MGSTRLPGKVLKTIKGKTLLEILIERLRQCKTLGKIIIATTDNKKDDVVVELAKKINCDYFRGDEDDVLDRFYRGAKEFEADIVVRISGDCPFHDPKIIDDVVDFYLENQDKYDYVSNVNPPTFPDGLDLWVFSFKILEQVWKEAKLKSEREHVCPYIWKNPRLFKIGHFEADKDYSHLRWTVDDATDFEFVKIVFENLYEENKIFSMQDILDFLNKNPDIYKIQENKVRDDGYLRSIKEDKKL